MLLSKYAIRGSKVSRFMKEKQVKEILNSLGIRKP